MRTFGLCGHQTSAPTNDEWLTPPEIIRHLGNFSLDPCASAGQAHGGQPWPTAKTMWCGPKRCEKPWCEACISGLQNTWVAYGRVWLNPPYSEDIGKWLQKLVSHPAGGMALVFARTDTGWFQKYVFEEASAVLFLKGRITFYHGDGTKGKYTGGAPSCIAAYGSENWTRLLGLQMAGKFVKLR